MSIQIENRMSYTMLGDVGSNEPDPTDSNPSVHQDKKTSLIGRRLSGRP